MKPLIDIYDAAQILKEKLSMEDIVGGYFPNPPPRFKRIPCPIHGGKGYNLSYNQKFFKCFVCGTSGDIITFVERAFRLDFRSAVKKIDKDFHMGLIDTDVNAEEWLAIRRAAERARAEREERQAEIGRAEERYHAALDRWCRADRALRETDTDSDAHAEAERNIATLAYLLEVEENNLASLRNADTG